jgi:hypothetical protein
VEVRVSDRPNEIKNQIELTRQILGKDAGEIHWSVAGLTKNSAMLPTLLNGPYKEKALIPKSSWIKVAKPAKPSLFIDEQPDFVKISWSSKNLADVFQWVVFAQYDGVWETEILTQENLTRNFSKIKEGKRLSAVAIKSVDRLGNESDYLAKKVK